MLKEGQKSQNLKKVAECLYRNANGMYFALIKVKGKQIKKSLKTTDRLMANRRLAEYREDAKRLTDAAGRNMTFDDLRSAWLDSVRPNLKPASLRRREVALNGLTPYFKGKQVRSIGFNDIEQWKKHRGGSVSARSHNIELETLDLLLRYANDRGIILGNPVEIFKRRK